MFAVLVYFLHILFSVYLFSRVLKFVGFSISDIVPFEFFLLCLFFFGCN